MQKKWNILDNFQFSIFNFQFEELKKVLLKNRGLVDQKEIDPFLKPDLSRVTFESVGIDAKEVKKTLKRLGKAIEKKEKIIVFGDYDVDGITGAAILWETLHRLGANVLPYIPARIEEGYGISLKGINNIKSKHPDCSLIITVDNGIVANDAVEFANTQGLEVIITDHHTKSEILPQAFSIVHTTRLCGAGIAWLLGKELTEKFTKKPYSYESDDHLELATLGTVADLVPLTGENRAIVTFGLPKLCKTQRKGLIELFKEAACDSSSLGVYQIGYIIAPRLNAAGRIGSAMDSLRLLCTKDAKRAYELASLLGETNRKRQTIMQSSSDHATDHVTNLPELKKILFVGSTNYQEGVIGLIAGRLVEEFYRPSIALSIGDKITKASARSVSGVNLIDFLRNASELMINVGGHPMAAGFTVETDKLSILQEKLEVLALTLVSDDSLIRTLRVDAELPLEIVSLELFEDLQKLSPFGMGNPEPTFVSRNVVIEDMKVLGKEGKHLKFGFKIHPKGTSHAVAAQDSGFKMIEGIAFGMGDRASEFKRGDEIDIVYTIDKNEWNGNTKLQIKLKDCRIST